MTTQTITPSRRVVICDLDNCLVDDQHRIPFIQWDKSVAEGRYDRYHALCALDGPANEPLAQRLQDFAARRIDIAFCTARPVEFRSQTEDWLRKAMRNFVPVGRQLLLMRNTGDHRSSVELKREQLASLLGDHGYEAIEQAFDDRFDVVLMYRELGVRAEQVKLHDTCAYAPPAPPAEQKPKRAPDQLEAGAATFRERNAIYGDTYLLFGDAMCAAFPQGLQIAAGDVAGFNRLGIYVQCLGKLLRYGPNLTGGGHQDSAHDLMVYGAMLAEVTK